MRRWIFSDDDDIEKQSKRYCFNQKFSISRTNQTHRYSNSLHWRKMIKKFIDLIDVFIDQMIIDDLTKSLMKDKLIQFRVVLEIESLSFQQNAFATTICESLSTSFATAICES
jgi:hypothetical protein